MKAGAKKLKRVPTTPFVTSRIEIPRVLSEQLDRAAKDAGMTKSQLMVNLCGLHENTVHLDDDHSDELDRLAKREKHERRAIVEELISREIALIQRAGIHV